MPEGDCYWQNVHDAGSIPPRRTPPRNRGPEWGRDGDSLAAVATENPRPRRRLVVIIVAALAAAVVVVGLAGLAARDEAVDGTAASAVAEPLPGRPPIVVPPVPGRPDDPAERVAWAEALATRDPGADATLRLAAALVDADRPDDAVAVLEAAMTDAPGPAAAGLALIRYDAADPEPSLQVLQGLVDDHPDDVFVRFSLGEALLWAGRRAEGESALRALRDATPETFYGIAADDLIHPGMVSGYPPFVAAAGVPDADLESLATAAADRPDGVDAQIAYAAALLGAGRRADARAAFDAALIADPTSLEAQVGAVMASFRKDDTASAFRQLGPLVRDHPAAASPRLHLALVLLWLRQDEAARAELRQIVENSEAGPLRDAADRLLRSLPGR